MILGSNFIFQRNGEQSSKNKSLAFQNKIVTHEIVCVILNVDFNISAELSCCLIDYTVEPRYFDYRLTRIPHYLRHFSVSLDSDLLYA